MTVICWHNPRCSKSRNTVALLQEHGHDVEIREYLKDLPSKSEIVDVLSYLSLKPSEVLRKGEPAFKEFKANNADFTEDDIIDFMVSEPIVIERPIVVNGNKAAIGRPPENVLSLF